MSTRFESASSERATYATFPTATALTFMLRFYLHSLPSSGSYAPLISLYDSFQGFWAGVNSSGRLVIFDYNAGVFSTGTGSTTLSTATWYKLWGRQADAFDPLSLYLDESTTADYTSSGNISIGANPMSLQFASNQAGFDTDYYADVSLCGAKLWSIDRAASNAAAEFASHAFVSTTNALSSYEFNGATITDGFSTRNLTATGTLSAGPDSPIDGGGGGPVGHPAIRRLGLVRGASPFELGREGGFVMQRAA